MFDHFRICNKPGLMYSLPITIPFCATSRLPSDSHQENSKVVTCMMQATG